MVSTLVIDYGVTNVVPLAKVLEKSGFRVDLTEEGSPTRCQEYDLLVLPGIGKWDFAKYILDSKGLSEEIIVRYSDNKKIFGVCLGMQLLAKVSEEGRLPGLGLLDCTVKENRNIDGITPSINNGWQGLRRYCRTDSPKESIESDVKIEKFYFSHSYSYSAKEFECSFPGYNIMTPEGRGYVASFQGELLAGAQFHPERSHKYGEGFLNQLRISWFK